MVLSFAVALAFWRDRDHRLHPLTSAVAGLGPKARSLGDDHAKGKVYGKDKFPKKARSYVTTGYAGKILLTLLIFLARSHPVFLERHSSLL